MGFFKFLIGGFGVLLLMASVGGFFWLWVLGAGIITELGLKGDFAGILILVFPLIIIGIAFYMIYYGFFH